VIIHHTDGGRSVQNILNTYKHRGLSANFEIGAANAGSAQEATLP
jgi:hypothetical protein